MHDVFDITGYPKQIYEIEIELGEYMRVEAINRCVFTGLTFSVSGMGTGFGQNAKDVLAAMNIIAALPDDT